MSAHNHLQESMIAEYPMPDTRDGESIVPDRSPALAEIATIAAETRSLLDPINVGIRLAIAMRSSGGNCVITAESPINKNGDTVITLADAGDYVELVAIAIGSDYRWRVVSSDGATLS